MGHSISIVQMLVTPPTLIVLIFGQNVSLGLKIRFVKFKLHISFFLRVMALRKLHQFPMTTKYLILKYLSILKGKSIYHTNLVTKTLLYIDSGKIVARYTNIRKMSAECQ